MPVPLPPVSLSLNVITGSLVTVPAGARAWSIDIQSGSAVVNGSSLNAPFSYSSYNSVLSPIVVTATGSAAAPSKAVVIWEVPPVQG